MPSEVLPPENSLTEKQQPELKLRYLPVMLGYVGAVVAMLTAVVLFEAALSIVFLAVVFALLLIIVPVAFMDEWLKKRKAGTR